MPDVLRRCYAWLPCKLHWFFVLLTAAVIPWLTHLHADKAQRGEWYPFSNFPMYSDFEKQAYYVYVTDLADQPLSVGSNFGRAPSDVKKAYDRMLKETAKRLDKPSKKLSAEERRPVAEALLRELREHSRPEAPAARAGLRLHQVDILLQDGRIVEQASIAGELP